MKSKSVYIFLLILFSISSFSFAQNQTITPKVEPSELTEVESRLINMINNFRKLNKLTELPVSKSLLMVAKMHASDLSTNQPDSGICGLHSWSDKGKWIACCETELAAKNCFEAKASEITGYKGKTIEMVFKIENEMSGPNVFQMIEKSQKAMDILLQKGIYSKKPWKAMGVGISGQYALIWFGDETDASVTIPVGEVVPIIESKNSPSGAPSGSETRTIYPTSKGDYYVTVKYTSTEKEAQAEAKKIVKMGYTDIKIEFIKKYFRLVFGPYPSMDEADKAKKSVVKDFGDAWIIKKDN